jgi:preprotein translocase subunit SecA
MSYFNEFNGRLFGLTGTLGSEAECQLLNTVFGVQFMKMPRFRRRFCSELNALLSADVNQWLVNVSKITHDMQLKQRAVLIVCENISAVNSIVKQLKIDLKNNEWAIGKIRAYTSSFDTQFQKEQQEKPLEPGDVIVATNLAGRGTDVKISATLEKNGGLHVIISYVPANARVEAQAQGRTARAGQPGTFQFVVCSNQLLEPYDDEREEDDVDAEMLRLKEERDEREAVRLERLKNRGLDKIKTEEELLKRFRLEIYKPLNNELQPKQIEANPLEPIVKVQ